MRYNPPSGYQAFPKSVRLWASITHPKENMTMALFDWVAASLVQEVQDKRLLAYLGTGTKIFEADFPFDGEMFRSVLNGDPVDLALPHVAVPATGVVVFRETDVIEAAEIARTFPSLRVPVGEALAWLATSDPEAVATSGEQPAEGSQVAEPESLAKLERAIAAGRIAVFGRSMAGENVRPVQPIPTRRWGGSEGLRICFGHFSSTFMDDFYAATGLSGPAILYDLAVCRTDLLREFPCPVKHLECTPPELGVQTSTHRPNPLHELIRAIADDLNPGKGAPMISAKVFRQKIAKAVIIHRPQSVSETTIKNALKGTRHQKPAKQKQT